MCYGGPACSVLAQQIYADFCTRGFAVPEQPAVPSQPKSGSDPSPHSHTVTLGLPFGLQSPSYLLPGALGRCLLQSSGSDTLENPSVLEHRLKRGLLGGRARMFANQLSSQGC